MKYQVNKVRHIDNCCEEDCGKEGGRKGVSNSRRKEVGVLARVPLPFSPASRGGGP